MDITEIQTLLNKVTCPQCRNATVEVVLRCDLGYGECLAAASCRTCGTLYEVSTERRLLERGVHEVNGADCPHCNTEDVRPSLRCELPSRKCFYVVRCRICDTPSIPAAA